MLISKKQFEDLPEKYKIYFESNDIKVKTFGQSGGANQALKEGKEEYLQDSIGMNRIKKLKNNHPCLKNMNLQYKIMNLFLCPKEDIKDFKILIPFCGVLSEYIPAMALGIPEENITGIEISKEYCEIGEARKAYWTKHNFYFKEAKSELADIKNKVSEKEKNSKIKKLF